MFRRVAVAVLVSSSLAVLAAQRGGGAASGPATALKDVAGVPAELPRAIRRDVPFTNSIRKAFDAGSRDFTGKPTAKYWQIQTDYTISASLDPNTDTITGTETIALHNNSPQDLADIVFRLDHNIFRAQAPHASASAPAEVTDGMAVTKITVGGETVDLSAPAGGGGRGARGGAAPAAGPRRSSASGLTTTVGRVALGTPIASKATANIEIEWHTKLPGGPGRGHRMTQRWDHTLYQPTQWYPRVAVYDDLRGWDTSVYMGPAEFYNNFGRFDVKLNVPAGWIVSGTGVLQNPQQVMTQKARDRWAHVLDSNDVITIVGDDEVGPGQSTAAGDRLEWHFVADMVNDFAWATAKNFVWKATRAAIPTKGVVPITMVYQPEHAAQYANAGTIARHALEFYSKLWAPYPFPQLTMQDGPDNGMEYPMVVNSNQGPADHEIGHQWWPMMVSNNETWYGWMDEGFNQYMNILSDADAGGTAPVLDGRGQSYARTSGSETEAPMMWPANDAGAGYSFQTYSKTPLMLSMLGGIVGDAEVQRAQSEYTHAWAFKHPSPWDYIASMNASLKKDLNWFWYYWLWTTESVDGSITNVTTAGTKTTVVVRQDGQMPSPVILEFKLAAGAALKAAAGPSPTITLKDANTIVATWPVDVWFSGSRTFNATVDLGGRKLESVTFDPGRRFPDHDPADNVWPRK